MSQWDTRIRDHAVWAELQQIGISIDRALERGITDTELISGIERTRLVIALTGKRLASNDALLIPPTVVNDLYNAINRMRNELDSFVANGNPQHVLNSNAYADEALVNLGRIPGTITLDDLSVISEATSSFRQVLEAQLREAIQTQQNLETLSSANTNRLAALETALAAEQAKLNAIVADHQSQFSSLQDRRASEFSMAQSEQQTKFMSVLAEQQTQFSSEQDSRRTSFSESQRENQEKMIALFAEYSGNLKEHESEYYDRLEQAEEKFQADVETLTTNYSSEAKGILEQIRTHQSAVESLVGVIGNLGVTSGYLNVANHARKMLYLWQGFTIAALGGLIWVAFLIAFPPAKPINQSVEQAVHQEKAKPPAAAKETKETTNPAMPSASTPERHTEHSEAAFYQGFATRAFLSITFGIFAAYAARQASRFFEIEQKNRRRALELEALGPFIEPLEKAQRDQFRLQIGERSFAVPDHDPPNHKEDDPVTALSLVKPKELGEALVNIIKAAKT